MKGSNTRIGSTQMTDIKNQSLLQNHDINISTRYVSFYQKIMAQDNHDQHSKQSLPLKFHLWV
jgi:hypothetical protein